MIRSTAMRIRSAPARRTCRLTLPMTNNPESVSALPANSFNREAVIMIRVMLDRNVLLLNRIFLLRTYISTSEGRRSLGIPDTSS